MLAAPVVGNLDVRTIVCDFVAQYLHIHARMRVIICFRRRGCGRRWSGVEWLILLPCQCVIDAVRPLIRIGFDQGPLFQIKFLFIAQKLLCARNGLFFCERRARRLFRQCVPHRVQRSMGLQDNRELFGLAVAEVTHAPQRSRNALRVDSVDSRNSHALPQVFVHNRIGNIDENGGVVIRIWIGTALAHDLVRACSRGACIHGQFQVFADGLRLQPPRQQTSPKQADREERDHAPRQCAIAP